jgi:hypothetical protein
MCRVDNPDPFPVQAFHPAEPNLLNEAYGIPRDIRPVAVAADTIGAQCRAGKCILQRESCYATPVAYRMCFCRIGRKRRGIVWGNGSSKEAQQAQDMTKRRFVCTWRTIMMYGAK